MAIKESQGATRGRLRDRLPARLARYQHLRSLSLAAMLPNITTMLSLCTGLSSVRFALLEQWNWAVAAIFISAILDTMDGRLARFLGSESRLGAELDSLADFICFGVSPALMIYMLSLKEFGSFGWAVSLFFTVCMALRLARFNTHSIEGTTPDWAKSFSVGTPAPAAAAVSLIPTMLYLHTGYEFFTAAILNVVIMIFVGILMVSVIPTYTLKGARVSHKMVLPFLLGVSIFAVALFAHPWLTLAIFWMVYLLTIPFSIRSYYRIKSAIEKEPATKNR